jgi:hypothetical protein
MQAREHALHGAWEEATTSGTRADVHAFIPHSFGCTRRRRIAFIHHQQRTKQHSPDANGCRSHGWHGRSSISASLSPSRNSDAHSETASISFLTHQPRRRPLARTCAASDVFSPGRSTASTHPLTRFSSWDKISHAPPLACPGPRRRSPIQPCSSPAKLRILTPADSSRRRHPSASNLELELTLAASLPAGQRWAQLGARPRAVRFAYGWPLPSIHRLCMPLLVPGNKRASGRAWPYPITGCLQRCRRALIHRHLRGFGRGRCCERRTRPRPAGARPQAPPPFRRSPCQHQGQIFYLCSRSNQLLAVFN